MKIVAVTACPTGIAHTYMAQAAIEQECQKRGYEIQVETQGGMGVENELDEKTIAQADAVILAVAVEIEGLDRFDEKKAQNKVIYVEPGAVIKNTAEIINRCELI